MVVGCSLALPTRSGFQPIASVLVRTMCIVRHVLMNRVPAIPVRKRHCQTAIYTGRLLSPIPRVAGKRLPVDFCQFGPLLTCNFEISEAKVARRLLYKQEVP